jgi:superfamily I DNA/RNA helicase
MSICDLMQEILDMTGYIEDLKSEGDIEAEARIENIDELMNKIAAYEESCEDEMPTLLSCSSKTKPVRYVKVNGNSKTKLEFGLISTPGNVNGSITIKDEFNNNLRFDDMVVSILNTEGREVCYTNINEDSTFSFSGLSPGKYVVEIDKELQTMYKIHPAKDSENYIIEVPPEYKDYVNIDNVNLTYKYEI